ncbi:CAAX prenyl protease-related protein [Armatimonas sp.]|uniref:CAAX prenyl protease-related protein n=1 Tax=Armatimonas sp. TaxID=1872638 RepID=UPI00286A0B8B|nr:CAAX prenyl protease-related protein [Armatimonas sp.]
MTNKPDGLPYAAPMVLFLVLTALEGYLPLALYPLIYGVKALLVLIALLVCARAWKSELRWDTKAMALGMVLGLLGLGLWLGLDALQPAGWSIGTRTAYNPFQEISTPALRYSFITVRFIGLVLLVPVMEEVFWRSFLLRFATDQDKWKELPLGQFSLAAFGIVAGLFAVAHPEWLAAIGYAALMAGLLRHTKSLLACVVAHGVTNAALGVFVLLTGNWKYW